MSYPFFLISLLFAVPELVVNWGSNNEETVSVQFNEDDELLSTCMNSGLEMEYQVEMQLCKRRPYWFDTCQDVRTLIRKVSSDPISRNYEMYHYWPDTDWKPKRDIFSSKSELRSVLYQVNDVPLTFLSWSTSSYAHSTRSYVSVRVQSLCQGEQSETLAAISQLLTLGLIELSGFDTGWVDFRLRGEKLEY